MSEATNHNAAISVVKGIAIILMVAGHAEAHSIVTNFIYLFHMPVFFIAAGYFFSSRNLDKPWEFCKKRFKGLYIPFIKWSLFFLLIHNILFHFGILNETYGNWEGGVTHPYSPLDFMQRFVSILFAMGGYDEFMAGAFWFFRALLLTSIGYLTLRLLIRNFIPRLDTPMKASLAICAMAIGFAALKIGFGLRIPNVMQGGIRETWGIFFFSSGVVIRNAESLFKIKGWMILLIFAFLAIGANCHWAGMNLSPKMTDLLTLPATGISGWVMLKWLAENIVARGGILSGFLDHCGAMTVYIYVFHIAAFKLVSLLKIYLFDLDFAQIGCHMVIHDYAPDDWFWVLYTIAGVGVPLLWMRYYPAIKNGMRNSWRRLVPALGSSD